METVLKEDEEEETLSRDQFEVPIREGDLLSVDWMEEEVTHLHYRIFNIMCCLSYLSTITITIYFFLMMQECLCTPLGTIIYRGSR